MRHCMAGQLRFDGNVGEGPLELVDCGDMPLSSFTSHPAQDCGGLAVPSRGWSMQRGPRRPDERS